MEYLGIDPSCALGSLRHGKFPDKDCLLPLISKLLGYAIVAASTTVKLPQILKILKHRSVRGLSMISFELEVVGYTIALAYCLHKGLPFSAYGELLFLLIQVFVEANVLDHPLVLLLQFGLLNIMLNSIVTALALSRRDISLTYFLLCFFGTAIILVAIIYYYSQPLGAITWIRALLYPTCLQ